jgi:hypothetical protein
VSKRLRILLVSFAAIAVLAAGAYYWHHTRQAMPQSLLSRFPAQDAVVFSVDFAALRAAGILQSLAGPNVAEEPEYKTFVRRTAFDYKRDLDLALIAFTPRGKFFLLKGRFDWKALRAYAESEGGRCVDSVCRLTGSAPDRRIGFFPLQSGIMALAVSPDDASVEILRDTRSPAPDSLPSAPVWVSLPQSTLRGDSLPTGTRMFARGMENAEHVLLSLAPDGRRFAARLDVRCRSEQDAAALAGQLTKTTSLLRELIARERQTPNPADLSGVLTSGAFRNQGRDVAGYWPIERSFVENLLSGGTT